METEVVIPSESNPVEVKPKKGILENSHFLLLSRKFIKRAKTIGSFELQMKVKTDTNLLHHQQDLFQCQELKNIASFDVKVDNFLKANTHPFPLHKGIYILPKMLFDEVENKLMAFSQERKDLIEKFITVYDQAVLDAKLSRKDLFDPSDYPTKEEARNAFKFVWHYKNFGVAENLEEINKSVAEREARKYKAEIEDATVAIKQMLRISLQSLVGHLVERLTPTSDGKKKVLRSSAIEGLNDFFLKFPAKDLTNDVALKALVDQAKAVTNGVTPDAVRTNDALRDNLQKSFSTIKEQLDKMVIDQPVRSLSFED